MHLSFLVLAFYMYTRIGKVPLKKKKRSNRDLFIKKNAYKELDWKENSYINGYFFLKLHIVSETYA